MTNNEQQNNHKVYKRIYVSVNAGEIYPFIPGTIVKYYVKKGDKVNQGDKLLVLAAMKMDNDVLSPINGTVKSINSKEGQRVSKNDIIMEIE